MGAVTTSKYHYHN